ncbi:SIR2 family protein [Citrobacter freundii]|nr:SIR2 family protein [Citrobacter freundii]MDT7162062.1 SIR2 family protein [Citrobacter freundii]
MQNRDFSKEIFTTNYDLVIEKSLEAIRAPYFDGFVGSYEPFFWQESVETLVRRNDLTQNWIRLWKIHGSLSWFWKKRENLKSHKVIRLGKVDKIEEEKNEIVIYPSKEKYDLSRRQPFLVYFDRLKNYLLNGELLFIFTGYSFLDQHINEIIFNCLRQNNRLSVVVFFYADSEVKKLHSLSAGYLNLSVFGPTTAIINGTLGKWSFDQSELKNKEKCDSFWNAEGEKFLLGDFNYLVEFLVGNSGRSSEIEVSINED